MAPGLAYRFIVVLILGLVVAPDPFKKGTDLRIGKSSINLLSSSMSSSSIVLLSTLFTCYGLLWTDIEEAPPGYDLWNELESFVVPFLPFFLRDINSSIKLDYFPCLLSFYDCTVLLL